MVNLLYRIFTSEIDITPTSRLLPWSLRSASNPAEKQELTLHSSVASLTLSVRAQQDNVEKVFPILRSPLLQCLCENVPRDGDEELKYFHASFNTPKHTMEAASKPPSVQTHASLMCPDHLLQESFHQLERNDELPFLSLILSRYFPKLSIGPNQYCLFVDYKYKRCVTSNLSIISPKIVKLSVKNIQKIIND